MKAMKWMMLSAILSLVLPVCPACGEDLSVPLLTTDDSLPGGRGTTWTTTLFGSYPQAEVVPDEDITCIDPEIISPTDFIIDPDLYEALQSASWT
ncbi:MAG: hypothetical protein IIZ39_11865, partial [Blautia sp.]|nr:hypothetical protein [Blautia sp.]